MPWHLGSLYSRLDECATDVVRSVGRYDVANYADTNFLQLFLWKRFKALSLMPKELKSIHPERVDGMDKVKTSLLNCRGRRWSDAT